MKMHLSMALFSKQRFGDDAYSIFTCTGCFVPANLTAGISQDVVPCFKNHKHKCVYICTEWI